MVILETAVVLFGFLYSFWKGRSYCSKFREWPWELPWFELQRGKRIRLTNAVSQVCYLIFYLYLPSWGNSCLAFLEGKDDWTESKWHLSPSPRSRSPIWHWQNKHSSAKRWLSGAPQLLCQNHSNKLLFTTSPRGRLLPFHQKTNMQRDSKNAFKVELPAPKRSVECCY